MKNHAGQVSLPAVDENSSQNHGWVAVRPTALYSRPPSPRSLLRRLRRRRMADHAGQPEAEQPREDAEPQDLWAEVLRAQEELRRLLAALQQPNVTDDERTTLYAQLAAVTAALGAAVAAPPAAAAALGAAAAAPPAAAAALPAAEHAAPPGSDRRPAERAGRALRRRHLGGHGSDSESVHSDDSVRTEDLQLNLAAVLHGAAELQAAEQQAGVEGPAAEQQVPEAGMAGAAAAAEQQAPEAGMAGAAAAAEQQAPGAGWADAQSPPEQLPAFGQQQAAGQLANELAQMVVQTPAGGADDPALQSHGGTDTSGSSGTDASGSSGNN